MDTIRQQLIGQFHTSRQQCHSAMLVVIFVADKIDRQPASGKSKQLKEYLLLHHVPILWRWKDIRGLLADSFTIILQPGTRYQTTFEIRCVQLTVFIMTWKLFFCCSTSIHSTLGASRLCAIQIYYWHWHWQCRHPSHKIATDIDGRQCQAVWHGSYQVCVMWCWCVVGITYQAWRSILRLQ